MRKDIQTLNSQLRQLKFDVGRNAGAAGGSGVVKGPDDQPIVCHRCGGNHFVANCDKPKSWKKEAKKEDGDEDDA